MSQKLVPIKPLKKPSVDEVECYLNRWKELENYHLQEDALNRLFPKTYNRQK